MEISESLFSWKQYCEFDISSIFLMIVIPKWKKKKKKQAPLLSTITPFVKDFICNAFITKA